MTQETDIVITVTSEDGVAPSTFTLTVEAELNPEEQGNMDYLIQEVPNIEQRIAAEIAENHHSATGTEVDEDGEELLYSTTWCLTPTGL